MKVYVIGANGMLGRYVKTYLKEYFYHDVISVGKEEIDAANITQVQLNAKLFHLGITSGDVIINCAGTIKPMVDKLGPLNAILVNSVFPRILANSAKSLGAKLIHPTTDCVFDGLEGQYTEKSPHNVTDVYGRTKSLGEPENCTVIRTSIIGEEVGQTRSLIEWVKCNKDGKVNGFTNHFWNGMTCLQFAKICKEIIEKNLFWDGVKHVFSNVVNKYELVNMISEVYGLNITVEATETFAKCDRSLSTVGPKIVVDVPSLKQQIIEMKEFSNKLYGLD